MEDSVTLEKVLAEVAKLSAQERFRVLEVLAFATLGFEVESSPPGYQGRASASRVRGILKSDNDKVEEHAYERHVLEK